MSGEDLSISFSWSLKILLFDNSRLKKAIKKQGHDDPALRIWHNSIAENFIAGLEQQALRLLPSPLPESSPISLYQSKGERPQARVSHPVYQ